LTMSRMAPSFRCCTSWTRVLAQVTGSGGSDTAAPPPGRRAAEWRACCTAPPTAR
jgi:hypothetical protein